MRTMAWMLALALTLGLAGCGDDDAGAARDAPAPPAALDPNGGDLRVSAETIFAARTPEELARLRLELIRDHLHTLRAIHDASTARRMEKRLVALEENRQFLRRRQEQLGRADTPETRQANRLDVELLREQIRVDALLDGEPHKS